MTDAGRSQRAPEERASRAGPPGAPGSSPEWRGSKVAGWNPSVVFPAEEPVVDHHREDLLDEERVSLRGGDDPAPNLSRERRITEQVLDDPLALPDRERLELE